MNHNESNKHRSQLVFLLGAGCSVPANIPAMIPFTNEFANHLINNNDGVLIDNYEKIKKAYANYLDESQEFNLEHLYEILNYINRPEERNSVYSSTKDGFPPKSRITEILEYELKKYIQFRCIIDKPHRIDYLKPLLNFKELTNTLDIVSLNYDTCIETLCNVQGAKWTDGFSGDGAESEWNLSDLNQTTIEHLLIRLLKIHGSVTWQEVQPGIYKRTLTKSVRQGPWNLGMARTLTQESAMIYPGIGKQIMAGIYIPLFARFQELLSNTDLCIAIGYAFGDKHIQDIFFNAMRSNPRLKIVIVNPRAKSVAEYFLSNAETALQQHRVFTVDSEKGRVDKALEADWLLNRTRDWLNGVFSPEEQFDFKKEVLSKAEDYEGRIQAILNVSVPLSGIVIDPISSRAYLARRDEGEIIKVDLDTWQTSTIPVNLENLRGIAVENGTNYIYVISNRYKRNSWELPLRPIEKKSGIGRLWEINIDSNKYKALTKINLLKVFSTVVTNFFAKQELSASWKNINGGLRWAYSIVVENPNESVFVTEARRLCRINIKTGRLESPINIPLCFNLVGVAIEDKENLLLLDAGVSGSSYSRLMRGNLKTGEIAVIIEGKSTNSFAIHKDRNSVFLSQGKDFPLGRVFELDIITKKEVQSWNYLNKPTQIAIEPNGKYALVTTMDGLFKLTV